MVRNLFVLSLLSAVLVGCMGPEKGPSPVTDGAGDANLVPAAGPDPRGRSGRRARSGPGREEGPDEVEGQAAPQQQQQQVSRKAYINDTSVTKVST